MQITSVGPTCWDLASVGSDPMAAVAHYLYCVV
jgi:hypothetical protein